MDSGHVGVSSVGREVGGIATNGSTEEGNKRTSECIEGGGVGEEVSGTGFSAIEVSFGENSGSSGRIVNENADDSVNNELQSDKLGNKEGRTPIKLVWSARALEEYFWQRV